MPSERKHDHDPNEGLHAPAAPALVNFHGYLIPVPNDCERGLDAR